MYSKDMGAAHFDTLTAARSHFRDLLDAAESGRPATVVREHRRSAVVDAERLRRELAARTPAAAEVVPEAGGWSVFFPGRPIAADGATFDEAVREAVAALREYAEDWSDHLLTAPNHADNWALVQIVELSTDEQLVDWITAA